MKIFITFLFAAIYSLQGLAQEDSLSKDNTPVRPLLIKKHNSEQTSASSDPKVVYRSNAGYAKIYKLGDSLYEFKAWENIIYLNKKNIEELKEAARMLQQEI